MESCSNGPLISLYTVPTAISYLLVSIVILLAVDADHPRHGKYRAPEAGVLVWLHSFRLSSLTESVQGTLFYSLVMLVISLPTSILTYRYAAVHDGLICPTKITKTRAITTPKKLSYFDLVGSLRALLTPTERRRPWILYLTPGLMAAETCHICVIVLFLGPLRRLLLPKMSQPVLTFSDISVWILAVYLIFLCASVLVLTPLEVIATRLAIQRNHASAEYNSVAQEVDGDAEDSAEYSGAEEDVIGCVAKA